MNPENISLIIASISFMGTVLVAILNIRGAHVQASDKIVAGSSALIDEIQEARKRDKVLIQDLEIKVNEFSDWKNEIESYMVMCWHGSKANEDFIRKMNLEPPYTVPDLPFEVKKKNE